jgi:hypothetical protein
LARSTPERPRVADRHQPPGRRENTTQLRLQCAEELVSPTLVGRISGPRGRLDRSVALIQSYVSESSEPACNIPDASAGDTQRTGEIVSFYGFVVRDQYFESPLGEDPEHQIHPPALSRLSHALKE